MQPEAHFLLKITMLHGSTHYITQPEGRHLTQGLRGRESCLQFANQGEATNCQKTCSEQQCRWETKDRYVRKNIIWISCFPLSCVLVAWKVTLRSVWDKNTSLMRGVKLSKLYGKKYLLIYFLIAILGVLLKVLKFSKFFKSNLSIKLIVQKFLNFAIYQSVFNSY